MFKGLPLFVAVEFLGGGGTEPDAAALSFSYYASYLALFFIA
jgi:hypothetical protein